jgi:SAM-dependent methyltransferase
MTTSEEMMASIMGYKMRQTFLREVAELLPLKASRVLDAGCGVGAVMALINLNMPSTHVVGLDLSKHMLTHQIEDIIKHNVLLVQACMPKFPFKSGSFDAVVAVQSLSEVLCFAGEKALSDTIEKIGALLRERGVFVVLDHQSPGVDSIEVNLTSQMLQQLKRFQNLFEYRPFNFEVLEDGWVQIAKRDLVEFITKIWSFDTPLEKEEMEETHAPFTGEEFAGILKNHGFEIDLVTGTVPIERYLKQHKVKIRPKQSLPERFFIVRAVK